MKIYRRICLLRLGITPDHPGSRQTTLDQQACQWPELIRWECHQQFWQEEHLHHWDRRVDPTLDAEIVQVSKNELDKMYGDYKAKFGAHTHAVSSRLAGRCSVEVGHQRHLGEEVRRSVGGNTLQDLFTF